MADVTDACGPDPGFFCELVFDNTENERLAEIIGWVVERPLRIVLILLVAWIIKRIAHKLVDRAVAQLHGRAKASTRRGSKTRANWASAPGRPRPSTVSKSAKRGAPSGSRPSPPC